MKKILLLVAFFLTTVTGTLFAQNDKGNKETFNWQKEYLDEAGISTDAQTKIDSLRSLFGTKAKDVRKDAALSDEQKKEKLKEVYAERGKLIYALLTPEQADKIKKIRERVNKE